MALRADDVDLGRDRALVVRFQAGDGNAFDDLYRRYFDRLQRFCERRVGDPHEAEELAQEAFVRALRAMPGFAGERRFYPWMTVIASRLCVDAHRRRQRSTPVAEVELGSVELDVEDLFAEVDREQLEQALGQLAPRHREVLDLREYHGWSYQRIADHYDVTLGTVEALLHRARRALRREFEKLTSGVPAVAWLVRRVDSLRTRATAQLGDLATPLSAAVASAALVAGSVAMIDAAHAPAPAGPQRPAVVSLSAGQLASSTTVQVPDAPPTPPPLVWSATTPTRSTAPTRAQDLRAVAQVESVTPDAARNRTASAAVREDVPGLGGLGLDPKSAIADTADMLRPIIRRNP
jgi:RNA polymerase sigma-70 factor (ECF subfamily)